jgi:hypothetical protein
MKYVPMPYSASMILAKLAGRKTQTRRAIKSQPDLVENHRGYLYWTRGHNDVLTQILPPRGDVGTRQYWQEAFDFGGLGLDGDCRIRYKADSRIIEFRVNERDYKLLRKWKAPKRGQWRGMPAMFMLKSMSRGMDEVMDLRVERVQDISEEDAESEGVLKDNEGRWINYNGGTSFESARCSFWSLWDSINAKRGLGWDANPWVWVYTMQEIK